MPDVVVVGAGHNGLVAAAYLARAGLSVEVFERREIVGGASVTEELWPGVRASPGAYTLSLLRGRIIEELDLKAHGLEVFPHDPYLFAPLPEASFLERFGDSIAILAIVLINAALGLLQERRAERAQFLPERERRDVAAMKKEIRFAAKLEAARRQHPRAARQMRVGNNGDARQA